MMYILTHEETRAAHRYLLVIECYSSLSAGEFPHPDRAACTRIPDCVLDAGCDQVAPPRSTRLRSPQPLALVSLLGWNGRRCEL